MSLNSTPSSERLHIAFFGKRNAGKSSVVNAVTGQELAVVSSKKGTTTDPVSKAMELLPLGPVKIIDTPGYDDEGELGRLRVKKTRQVLNRADLAVLVVDVISGLSSEDREMIRLFQEKKLPHLIVYNKTDLLEEVPKEKTEEAAVYVSALTGEGIYGLKERMASMGKEQERCRPLVKDLIKAGDMVLLVIPIDASAPKGRLILPQQQVIRDILEGDGAAVCVKENDLTGMLTRLAAPPALVITDSQVFGKVAAELPEEIPLTSFSILMARYKGFLDIALGGVTAIDLLEDGDLVLIAEGCTHHRQCEDIGTVKIPKWLRQHTGKDIRIETCSGRDFPLDLSPYRMIIHCGGCMLNEREMRYRMRSAAEQGIPITNYGTVIAFMKGILKRSIMPLYTQVRHGPDLNEKDSPLG